MSRAGKHPVAVPSGVKVNLVDNSIEITGPKGTLKRNIHSDVVVKYEGTEITVNPKDDSMQARALWGTTRRFIAGMVKGVTEGFAKVLEINGVGFKAAATPKGDAIRLTLGFSHDIMYIPQKGVTLKTPKPTQIDVEGVDPVLVGQTAAEIRAYKKPEPYKGKGIKYSDETIHRKEGKKK